MFFFFIGAREALDSPELDRFARALETIQARYPSMTMPMLATLLRIGTLPAREGDLATVSDVAARSPGQKYPTIARQIDLLGDGNGRSSGLRLLEKRADDHDGRVRYVAVSERGRQLLQELTVILAPTLFDPVAGPLSNE